MCHLNDTMILELGWVIWDIGQASKGMVVSEILTVLSVVIGKFWAFFGWALGSDFTYSPKVR